METRRASEACGGRHCLAQPPVRDEHSRHAGTGSSSAPDGSARAPPVQQLGVHLDRLVDPLQRAPLVGHVALVRLAGPQDHRRGRRAVAAEQRDQRGGVGEVARRAPPARRRGRPRPAPRRPGARTRRRRACPPAAARRGPRRAPGRRPGSGPGRAPCPRRRWARCGRRAGARRRRVRRSAARRPASGPTFAVTEPNPSWRGQPSKSCRATAARASRTTALSPSSGAEPCAARPCAESRIQCAPLCAGTSRFAVGSATTSGPPVPSADAGIRSAPSQPVSSPDVSTTCTPRHSWVRRTWSATATTRAATPDFMSLVPRPTSRSPSGAAAQGSTDQSDGVAGTVSRCPVNVSGAPEPARATYCSRPSSKPTSSPGRPASERISAQRRASTPSRAPTVSARTSSTSSSAAGVTSAPTPSSPAGSGSRRRPPRRRPRRTRRTSCCARRRRATGSRAGRCRRRPRR